MLKLNDYLIFRKNSSSLRETSSDHRDHHKNYLTDLECSVVDFDAVTAEYVRPLGLKNVPMSNDALMEDGRGGLIFIEFKNGKIKSKTQYDIRKKIYDSTLIFTDLTKTGVSFMRKNVDYILVYNKEQNHPDINVAAPNEDDVQESEHYQSFTQTLHRLGGKSYKRFGIDRFEGYIFRKTMSLDRSEFEQYISGFA